MSGVDTAKKSIAFTEVNINGSNNSCQSKIIFGVHLQDIV